MFHIFLSNKILVQIVNQIILVRYVVYFVSYVSLQCYGLTTSGTCKLTYTSNTQLQNLVQ